LCTKATYTMYTMYTMSPKKKKKGLAMRDRGILFRVSISTVGKSRPRVRKDRGLEGPRVRRTKGVV
jgi:hypothetical protein